MWVAFALLLLAPGVAHPFASGGTLGRDTFRTVLRTSRSQ